MSRLSCKLFIFVMLAFCGQASAQNGVTKIINKGLELMDSMAVKGIDRNYIDIPDRPWQIVVKNNMNQSIVRMKTTGMAAGVPYSIEPYLKTEMSQYIGLWVGYRGHGVGYTMKVGGKKGGYLSFASTSKAYGLNLRIHRFENDHPRFDLNTDLIPEEDKDDWQQMHLKEPIKVHSLIADGYYMFNSKQFSYAAAYKQSVLQKRSAGSLMAGAMYYYGHIDYASDMNADLVYLMHGLGKVKLWQASVGVGYAYNWVPARGWIVNVMAMPMLTFVNKIKAYGYATNVPELLEDPRLLDGEMSDEEWDEWWENSLRLTPMGETTFNGGVMVNFDARLSLSYNFGRYFLNVFGQFNNNRYHHNGSKGYLNDWFVNTSLGVRL
jgi:hypothetical protein